MRDILEALRPVVLAQLTYLGGCEIIEDPDLPPEFLPLPFVGLKDGNVTFTSGKGADDDSGFIFLYTYQAIVSAQVGASLIGYGENRGLFQIAEDLRTLVNDNDLMLGNRLPFFHMEQQFSSQAGVINTNTLIQRQQLSVRFMRVTS